MTLRSFPPADQCEPEDLDAISDLVVSDPRASYDLAGSREHIEALCKRYQELAQNVSGLDDSLTTARRERNELDAAYRRRTEAQAVTIGALQRDLARATNHLDEAQEEIADLKMRIAHRDSHRAALGDLAFDLLADIDSAHTEIRALTAALDAERNERQAEVLQAEADRERADEAETRAEQMRNQLEAMAALLDQQAETRRLDDQLRSTTRAVTGRDYEVVQQDLDAELAANPDAGPLHHARDQREQEDSTP